MGLYQARRKAVHGVCTVRRSLVLLASLGMAIVEGFPSYTNPITAEPPLDRPGQLLCTLPLITNAACDGYDKITLQDWSPPGAECAGKVEKTVLDVEGKVKGVQYDRFGSLSLCDVELLRLTTPEPSATGITWHVEKDVSEYLQIFLSPSKARLAIPNVVDDTYTGVIYVNATISFYGSPEVSPTSPEQARNLRAPTHAAELEAAIAQRTLALSDPWQPSPPPAVISLKPGGASLRGNESLSFPLKWPVGNVVRAYLDLYASGHACEEFWYTNVPDEDAKQSGLCGGGTYRELQVYIDGRLAGAAYPFVVLYTGGVNPMLWRPLTGIMSFNIPAYRFDLTPFAGELNAGGAHSMSITVVGSNAQGVWVVNPVLLLHQDAAFAGQRLAGAVDSTYDSGASFGVRKREDDERVAFKTAGRHCYSVSGWLGYPNGTRTRASVEGNLLAWNDNTLESPDVNKAAGVLTGWHAAELQTEAKGGEGGPLWYSRVETRDQYPYSVDLSYREDNSSMEMTATMEVGLERAVEVSEARHAPVRVSWANAYKGSALYNRTLDRKTTHKQAGDAEESFLVSTGLVAAPCYARYLTAHNGSITRDDLHNKCHFSPGLSFCGVGLCPQVEGVIAAAGVGASQVQVKPKASTVRAARAAQEGGLRAPLDVGAAHFFTPFRRPHGGQ